MWRHPHHKVLRTLGTLGLVTSIAAVLVGVSACTPPWASAPVRPPAEVARSMGSGAVAYADMSDQALTYMLAGFYANGRWKTCTSCSASSAGNADWGDDAMTYALWLRWKVNHHDARVIPELQELAATAPAYGQPCASASGCGQWSDVPMWDSIALGREYEATGAQSATILAKEQAAFASVDGADPSVFAFGACPSIHYQQPGGRSNQLKTLETDANYIKAALLLYRFTHDASYLTKAEHEYAAVRHYFLDRRLALYSVYVFDDGTTCRQVPGRFFASVNGAMIDNGIQLAAATRNAGYLREAIATGQAVALALSDARGVYTDLQAENDIVEPLVEGMYALAADEGQPFARRWLQTAASAAASSLSATGAYSRMFDGPANPGAITIWQTNGGYALAFAAAGVDPNGSPATTSAWANATRHSSAIATSALPASITFTGAGIALLGTLGEQCCEAGHARVFLDGIETTDTTGIWQNKSSSSLMIPDTVLFAWRWPSAGTHTVTISPGIANAKEGGPFVHIQAYLVAP